MDAQIDGAQRRNGNGSVGFLLIRAGNTEGGERHRVIICRKRGDYGAIMMLYQPHLAERTKHSLITFLLVDAHYFV